ALPKRSAGLSLLIGALVRARSRSSGHRLEFDLLTGHRDARHQSALREDEDLGATTKRRVRGCATAQGNGFRIRRQAELTALQALEHRGVVEDDDLRVRLPAGLQTDRALRDRREADRTAAL